MYFQHKNVSGHNRLSLQTQQAFFAARAAMQHFLLKAKLFPTELYDAVEFTQGKNPLCDFSEYSGHDEKTGQAVFKAIPGYIGVYQRIYPEQEKDSNGKIKYFYIQLQGRPDAYIRIGSYFNPDFRYLAPNLASSDAKSRYTNPDSSSIQFAKPDKYLEYYIRDCTNEIIDTSRQPQPALETKIGDQVKTAKAWKISEMMGYPYTMFYKVRHVSIGAMKELRKYNEEAIEIEVEGSIFDFKGVNYTQIQKKVQKITRRGAL